MTLLPLTDCGRLLGIDPKTLRLWLQSANVSWTLHPSDARLKCLTQSQLHHLAHLHGRFLPDPPPRLPRPICGTCSPTCKPRSPPSKSRSRTWL